MQKQYNAGLYLRLSVEDAVNSQKRGKTNPFQNESSSIENQRVLLTEYVNIQGWNVTQTYIDDGYSGGSFDNRPAFQRMVRDAEDGLVNLILVKDLSRFGRDYIETGRYTDEVFPSLGVRFIALMDNIDSEGNDDLLPFRSILNDYHLKDLSRKVKSVLKAKAEQGKYVGKAPYGYIKDSEYKNHLLIDEYSANVVRRIFNMRAQGVGCASIAATLNNEGILAPRSYRDKLAGVEKPPKMWIACTIYEMLANEAYIGNSVRFKTGFVSYKSRLVIDKPEDEWIRCEDAFPSIISLEIWEAVRKMYNNRPERKPRHNNAKSLFHGLLRCADCGGSLIHKTSYSKSRVTGETTATGHAYICSKNQTTGGSVCTRHTIREQVLLTIIREDISRLLESISIDEGEIARVVQRRFNGESLSDIKTRRDQLTARLDELEAVGIALYEDRLGGIINIDTFKMLSEKAENEKSALKDEHGRLSDILSSEESRIAEIGNIIPKLREFLALENMTRDTLAALIDHVIVSESDGRNQNRTHDVQIIYRFKTAV